MRCCLGCPFLRLASFTVAFDGGLRWADGEWRARSLIQYCVIESKTLLDLTVSFGVVRFNKVGNTGYDCKAVDFCFLYLDSIQALMAP